MIRKLGVLVFVLALLILPVGSAAISVEKVDKGSVVISELNNPAVFDFIVTNYGGDDNAEIYSLVGVSMSPKGTFKLPGGKTTLHVLAFPSKDVRSKQGLFTFQYQIKGDGFGIFQDTLSIDIVSLKNAISIDAENVYPGNSSSYLLVKNLKNTNLEDLNISASSALFKANAQVSLKPYESVRVPITIDVNKTKSLLAGPYVILSDVNYAGAKTTVDGLVNYLEKEGLSVNETHSGFIIRQTEIVKTNEGNKKVLAEVTMGRDMVSRLFTKFSVEPTTTERKGVVVNYIWRKDLSPAESLDVVATTNYTIPFFLVLLVGSIGLFVWIYTRTSVVVSKNVSLVKTRGGEFALKVRLSVRARKNVRDVQIIDSLPGTTKLYNKFGTRPDKIEESTRRLFWQVHSLNSGEERVFSYILYSKLKIVGRFELPSAAAVFKRNGNTEEVLSNKAFFVSDVAREN